MYHETYKTIVRCLRLLLVMLLPAVTVGCAGLDWMSWQKKIDVAEASETDPVSKVICIWEPAEGNGMDGLPTRGIAGQILFFTKQYPTPVLVDGDVRVYLFDDRGSLEERAKPIHQFDFLGDAWKIHGHKSSLGPAYNVFIPYVRKHNQQVNCGLQLRLKQKSGQTIFSQIVYITLPGSSVDATQHVDGGSSETSEKVLQNSGMTTVPLGAVINEERIVLAHHEPSGKASTRARARAVDSEFEVSRPVNASRHVEREPLPNDLPTAETSDRGVEKRRSHRLAQNTSGDETAFHPTNDIQKPHPLDESPTTKHPLLDEIDDDIDHHSF